MLLLALGAAIAPAAQAKVFFSKSEALELAFPEADRVERTNHTLTREQAGRVEEKAKATLESRIITLYTGFRGDELLGYAFIDIHTVRTLPGAFLVVLSPQGEVRSLRVLAFYEPREYLPSDRWLEQFDDRRLDPALRLGGEIHGIAGSTLSSRVVTGGVRRSLALFELLVTGSAQTRREAAAPGDGRGVPAGSGH